MQHGSADRPSWSIRIVLAIVVTAGFLLATGAFAQQQFIAIGGGSTGGTFNVFASGIGDIVGRSVEIGRAHV